ncbi:MAG: Ig-like domain-containing protein, partial [Cyclobacteriaceae bacterium]
MMNSSRKKLCLLFFLFFLSSAFVFNNKTKIFISNREYNDTLVFKNVLSSISNHSKNRDAQGRLAYFKGYVLIPTGRDSGKEGGGFNFFDLSNPEKPILVKSIYTEETNLMREPHQFSISKRNGRDYIAVQSIRGILVFDFTDTFNPILVAEMTLPDIVPESDYSAAVWGVFWSGDHIYACGRENGLYVINVSDIGKPVLVKQFYLSELANTNANSIYILGNTMYLTSDSKLTVGTLTTPTTLSLNSTIDYPSENYSANYANGRVFSLGKNGKIAVVNVSDPYNLKLEGETDKLGSRGGYASYQSGYLFAGMSSSVTKVNIKDLSDYKVYEPNIKYTDWDFLNPIGNLIHLGNDHNHGGSLLMHHDGKRDKTGPWVDVFYPENKSIVNRNIVLGFAFSELLDYESVHAKNIIIKEKFTEKIVKGMFSCQQGIVNFTPSSPLKSNTTYQVSVKNNTIKDMLGNTNERSYQYSFTTNEKLVQEPCKIVVDNFRVKKGKKIFLSVFDESKGAKWEWSFGDQTNGIGRYVKHAFDKAGHYNVVVKQKGSDCSCNQLVTVYESLQERKPIESKKIITFKDENNTRFNGHFFNKYKEHFVTVLPDHNKVEYFVVKRGEVFRSATRSKSYSGKKPTSLTQVNGLDPEKRYIWVVNEGDATITEFYFEKTPTKKRGEIIEKLKKSRSISLPKFSKPLAIVPSYSGKKVYVSLNAIGKIAVIDVDAGKVENLVSIGGSPGELALAVDDKTLYVAHLFQQNGKGIISKVNVLSLKEEDQLIIQKDPGPDLDEGGRGVANILTDVVISPSGSKLLVSSKKDNIERGTLRDGNPLNFKNTVRSIVSEIDIKS